MAQNDVKNESIHLVIVMAKIASLTILNIK